MGKMGVVMRQNNLTKLVNKEELLKKTKMYSDSNDEVKGNDIYINLDNADNTDDIIKTIGHETAHNNTKDEMVAKNTENFASRMNSFKELINFAGKGNSNNEIIKHHITRTTQNDLMRNNELARRVVDRSDRVVKVGRNLNLNVPVIRLFTHTFTVFIPDKPEEFTKEKFEQKGIEYVPPVKFSDGSEAWIMGAYGEGGNLTAEFNKQVDVDVYNSYNDNKDNMSERYLRSDAREIEGKLSDTEVGYNLIKKAQDYIYKTSQNPIKYNAISGINIPKVGVSGCNCNSFTRSLLIESGGNIKDFERKSKDRKLSPTWGKGIDMPEYYFNNN